MYIYLDNSATTKMDKEVLNKMLPYFTENYGNASSIYRLGQQSKKAIEDGREQIANAINCMPEEIYFTSGGSESNNTIIKGIFKKNKNKGNHIITTKIEHPSILNTCKQLKLEGAEITYLDVNKDGIINIEELKKAIRDSTILITIMFANNEMGAIQPIEEIGKIAKERNIIFHTDAVQAIGIEKIDVEKMNIDSLSMSAHKFYGPKGIGALYVKNKTQFCKLIEGGHQERNKRAGTENIPAIVGMGQAMENAYNNLENNRIKIRNLRDYLLENIKAKINGVCVNGGLEHRTVGNLNISIDGIDGQSLLINLDKDGIYASLGSACASGSIDPSYVLMAIGIPEEKALSSLRLSIGKHNTKEEMDYVVEKLKEIVSRLRKH